MGAYMDVVTAIALRKNFLVAGHEDGYGIREQQHSRRYCACQPISTRKTNAEILQIHGVHQVMQGHVRVFPREARDKRCAQSCECINWIVAERAEEQVKPHHVGIELAEFGEQPKSAVGTVRRPAAYHRKAMELLSRRRDFVAEDGELDK